MTTIESVTIEVSDPTAAAAFYTAAFDLSELVGVRATEAPTTGFRGFTMSLVVSQPSTVDSLIGTALDRIVIGSEVGAFTDPDGFAWETASVQVRDPSGNLVRIAQA